MRVKARMRMGVPCLGDDLARRDHDLCPRVRVRFRVRVRVSLRVRLR